MKKLIIRPASNRFVTKVKKTCLFILIFMFFTMVVYPNEVDLVKAKRVAVNCFAEKAQKNPINVNILEIFTETKNELPLIYIFNFKNGGYILLAADNVSIPIIGYSEKGKFQQGNHSPAFQNQLNIYKEQIYDAIVNDIAPYESTKFKWEQYYNGTNLYQKTKSKSIEPLLTSTWNQDSLYNDLCPEDLGGIDGHVYTGCVATAMAQVLNYWSHPWYGNSSHGYTHADYGYLSADFQNTLYNYDSMPDVLTIYNNHVATLLYHCGVSVEMDYGPNGSGAWGWVYPGSEEVHNALIDYFHFSSSANNISRSSHPIAWTDMIIEELDNGRPVIYGGKDLWSGGGHAWVVDGYSGDLFHMNWGWGGNDDDYFTLDDLTPSPHNFNEYNHAIFDAKPKLGSLNGIITQAESPYELFYDHKVPIGETLIIQPGVEMIFRGRYSLTVEGQLEALGTASDTIIFTADPIHGWGGLHILDNSTPDSSRFRYCKFFDGLAYHKSAFGSGQFFFNSAKDGGAVYCSNAPAVSFSNCLFTYNYSDRAGGAIYCEEGSDILINNCIISYNKSGNTGGGLVSDNSSLTILNTNIYQNESDFAGGGIYLLESTLTQINDSVFCNKSLAGGGIYSWESSINMTNVQIHKDSASDMGGGIFGSSNSSIVMTDVDISNNNSITEGGGLFISGGSSLEMINSKIVGNSSSEQHGGGILCGLNGNVQLKNVLIYGNFADSAGGVFIRDNSAFSIDNVTISNNQGFINTDELTIQNGNFTSKNSIIWYQNSDNLKVTGSSNINCTYSNIKGGEGEDWFGIGCVDINPQFTNAYNNDFTLFWDQYPEPSTKSPCIDTGDPTSLPDPDGTRADMGAIPFEQVHTPLPAGDVSGILSCAGSPYYVQGNITVQAGEELIIEPCVYLVFRGDYKLLVKGRLLAEGTDSQKIGFMPSDTIEGWRGIRFLNNNTNGQDSSRIVNARILYGNSTGYYENGQGGGVFASHSSNLLISDSYFFRNRADTHGGAIYLGSSSSPLIRRSSFYQNESSTGGGIACYGYVDAIIEDCILANNIGENGGAISAVSCAPILSGTSIFRNHALKFGGGLYRSGGQVPTFDEINRCNIYDNYANLAGLDFYADPNVITPPVTEVFLDSGSVSLFNEHFAFPINLFDISSNYSMFIQENADLYVNTFGADWNSGTSPSEPLRNIKTALIKIIADENNPRTIYIADGVYGDHSTAELFPINLRSYVTLAGESRENTIIIGDSLNQLMTSYADVNDSIRNLSLKRGYSDVDGGAVIIEHYSNPTFHDVNFEKNSCLRHGGAVWCYNHSSPTFSHVTFRNNSSNNSGGAFYSQTNDTIILDHVYFEDNITRNSGGGIYASYDDFFWLRNTDFVNNQVFNGDGGGASFGIGDVRFDSVLFFENLSSHDGGGLFGYGLDLEVVNSSFISNYANGNGGGFYFYHSADVNMLNVIFDGNSSQAGGGIWGYLWSTLNVQNGLFINNNTLYDPYSNGDGGALNLRDVATNLSNVTISENVADGNGDGMFCWNNSFSIQNSIFWQNSSDQIFVDGSAIVDIQYSNIEGSWPGTGNIDTDPLFVDPSNNNFHLQSSSPCINTGNPDTTGLNLSMFDLDGSPRISSHSIDMGAYELFEGIILDLRVFLEGPFNETDMNTGLKELTVLPKEQPYTVIPWNYSGSEEVASFPDENVVDWLLLEIRDTTDISVATANCLKGQQAVLLLGDGTITDINGFNPRFGNPIENQCYVVLRHRNHLDIISASPLSSSGDIYSYNFTTGGGQAYGTDAQKNLGGGIYGMFGGDADANGTINSSDKSGVWENLAGKSGYSLGDLNMDSRVDNQDKNEVWLDNDGQTSYVPE